MSKFVKTSNLGFLINKFIYYYSAPSSSRIDGTIYSLAEDHSEGQISLQPRSETMDNLARSVINKSSDDKHTKYSTTKSYDRFPFSSRPPQFNPNHNSGVSKTEDTTNTTSSIQLYSLYSQNNKLKSKPSLSNPNVLFCTPDDMTRSNIY